MLLPPQTEEMNALDRDLFVWIVLPDARQRERG